jgi:5'-nucleotidase/UDP-sugar diphosphatase
MSRWIRCILGLSVAFCLGCGTRTFVIYHTSDVHGHIAKRPAAWHKPNPKRLVGGYAAMAQLVAQETEEAILLDSGDIFQGTPEGTLTQGEASIALMNQLGYSAMAVGNHEYDLGEAVIRTLANQAQFPFLAANITRKADGKPVSYAKPTHVMTVNGIRVGIVGIATHQTATATMPKNVAHLHFGDEVSAAAHHAKALRADGAQVIIALTHCGAAPSYARKWISPDAFQPTLQDLQYVGDIAIARGADVDMVLGGHTHTGLDRPWVDPVSGVPIAQSYENLIAVNRIEITVDTASGRVQRIDGQLMTLWIDQTGESKPVLTTVARYRDQVNTIVGKRLGTATNDIGRDVGGHDSALGNWMTDIMRAAGRADVAIQNTHGIRDDLRAGPVTLRDLFRIMPFDNTLVIVTLTGRDLAQLIRSNFDAKRTSIQLSGVQVHYQTDPQGKSVTSASILVNGKPIDPEKQYTVATNNYLASGGGVGALLKGKPQTDTGQRLRAVVADHVKKHSPVSPPPVGRFIQKQ